MLSARAIFFNRVAQGRISESEAASWFEAQSAEAQADSLARTCEVVQAIPPSFCRGHACNHTIELKTNVYALCAPN